jgi:hypothetical protein
LIAKETKNLCEASSCGIGLWRDIHREHRRSGFWLQALLQKTVKWRQQFKAHENEAIETRARFSVITDAYEERVEMSKCISCFTKRLI